MSENNSDLSKSSSNTKVLGAFYNDMSALRAAISAIPFIGTFLDLTISLPGQKFAEERLEYLISQLQEEIANVKDAIVDNTFLKTEEGYDLIQRTFIAGAKTRQKEKLQLFAKILRGAYLQQQSNHNPELYVSIVDELSARELEALFLLYREKETWKLNTPKDTTNNGRMLSDAEWFSHHYRQFPKGELEYIFPRLERTGLIKEVTGSYMGLVGGTYNSTPLCNLFISFIENNNN